MKTPFVTYRQIHGTSWVAWADDSRQAIWESWSEEQLIQDLLAKGYERKAIKHKPLAIVVIR